MSEVRLIDANFIASEMIAAYYENPKTEDEKIYNLALTVAKKLIRKAPTIDAEPVRYGQWILCEDQSGVDNDNNNYAYLCSQCHHQDVHSTNAKVNFCWNCGARMDVGYINVITKESEP